METRENILQELKEIAPRLASLEKKNNFAVPDGYFLNFKNNLLEQVKLQNQELSTVAPSLLNIEKKNTAEVPAGYFNAFSADLMKKIRADEIASELSVIAPTLSTAEKKNTMQVPTNYFAQFPQQMMERIAQQQTVAESVTMPKWLQAVNAVLERITVVVFKPKYSFAFAGTATLVIMAVMMFVQVEQQCTDLDCKMAALTDDELNAFLDVRSGEGEEVFELNAAEDLQSTENNIGDALNMLSDEELNGSTLD
ncbi:MAG TPA: hypothetical protein VK154_03230 [Chitinophagales bacterium]|nr:hypothetical protein [Chitinophagales bacterium]